MGTTRPLPNQSARSAAGRRRPRTSRGRRYARRAAITGGVVVAVAAIAVAGLWVLTPSASEATTLAAAQAKEHGIAYPGPSAPANFAQPLIATEDKRFYSEPGVDPLAVGRVAWAELTGGTDQGGATLEQQLAKLLYTPDQTGFTTEVKQVVLAFKIDQHYSKQQILDLYAEAAYYGHGFYGLQAASCGYFGHPADQLTVNQGAMLAGVVNAPSVDDPISDPANARARLSHVLDRMVAVGDLSSSQAQTALTTSLGLTSGNSASC